VRAIDFHVHLHAFVLGVKDGEFDLDENGNVPPVPAGRQPSRESAPHRRAGG
jgi:hypothetical protein